MTLLTIDPGNEQSAWMLYDGAKPVRFGICKNDVLMLDVCRERNSTVIDHVVIETVASYGMAVGKEVFETCIWIGRFWEKWWTFGAPVELMYRRQVKMQLCGNNTAKDANIRQSLIDRFGPGKEKAIGKKAAPGPLYGVSKDCWSALAIAVTWFETRAA